MTSDDILMLNCAAAALGLDDTRKVIQELKNNSESELKARDLFMKIINGPFGQVDTGCNCKAWEGYVQAIQDMIEAIDDRPVPHRNDIRAVLMEREELIETLRLTHSHMLSDNLPTQQ